MDRLIVSIIPARGNSKGLRKKNIFPISGRPLLEWTIQQSISSKEIQFTFVSTNDKEIVEISKKCGAKTIIRPEDLCQDDSTSESALFHALDYIRKEHNLTPDIIVFLQATSPLRLKTDIDKAIQLFFNSGADSLFSVTKLNDLTIWEKKNNNWKSFNFDYKKRLTRQERSSNYIENGSIYIFKPEILEREMNRLGGEIIAYEMEFWQTWEIDSIHEIDLIEYYMKKYIISKDEVV